MCYSLGGPVPSTDGLSRPSSSNTVTAAGAGLTRIGHALRGFRFPGRRREPVSVASYWCQISKSLMGRSQEEVVPTLLLHFTSV